MQRHETSSIDVNEKTCFMCEELSVNIFGL